jgi:4-hydroxy-tetrahydrodipicolinate synthase
MNILSRQSRGVIPIVPTPFDDEGRVDLASIPKLIAYYQACGVIGLTILGVMGEASKLTQGETEDVVETFVSHAKGRLPVIVGVSGTSLAASAALALWSQERGAFGVMLQAMSGLQGDDALVTYFEMFAERTQKQCPICVQDYPVSSGVHMSVAAWRRIAKLESVFMLKHEPPAGLQKLSQIRASEKEGACPRIAILTSNNAMHLSQELDRGADGAMVGVAYTDLIVLICRLYAEGQVEKALDIYDAVLPLIRHESQGAFGLAIRKEILRRRGVLRTGHVRYPGVRLTDTDHMELTALSERLERRLKAIGVALPYEAAAAKVA